MSRPKIVADARIPYLRPALDAVADTIYLESSQIDASAVADADALLIRTRTQCDEHLLANSHVRLIASAAIGLDHVDRSYCEKRGITVTNAPGCNAWAVVQWILSALVFYDQRATKALKESVVGIVGHGNIGSRLDAALRMFGVKTLLCDPFKEKLAARTYLPIQRLAKDCDIITFHVPLTDEGPYPTYHLADRRFLHSLKKKPLLINTSRGGVIDDYQLLEALNYKHIRGYMLDVYEDEPDLPFELVERAVIATPHIAGYSLEGKRAASEALLQAVAQCFDLTLPDVEVDHDQKAPFNPGFSLFDLARTFDIEFLSRQLKASPQYLERLRNEYELRLDYRGYEFGSRQMRELIASMS